MRVGIDLSLDGSVREARQSLESGMREEFLGCRVDPDACQAGIAWHNEWERAMGMTLTSARSLRDTTTAALEHVEDNLFYILTNADIQLA